MDREVLVLAQDHRAALGPDRVLKAVRFWIKLARQHGFGLQFSVRLPIKFRQFRKQFATERHQRVPGLARRGRIPALPGF